jgi:transposase-like protein
MPEKKKRNHRSPAEKAAIVRRHLVDKVPVSELCDEYGIQPSVFYGWQKQAFENLEGLFAETRGGKRAKAAMRLCAAGTTTVQAPSSAMPRDRPEVPTR